MRSRPPTFLPMRGRHWGLVGRRIVGGMRTTAQEPLARLRRDQREMVWLDLPARLRMPPRRQYDSPHDFRSFISLLEGRQFYYHFPLLFPLCAAFSILHSFSQVFACVACFS